MVWWRIGYVGMCMFGWTNAFMFGGGLVKWGLDQIRAQGSYVRDPIDTYAPNTESLFQKMYDLQWYVVGVSRDFTKGVPKKINVRDRDYVVWKDSTGTFHALDNACWHRGASLADGVLTRDNCVVCPYHGITYTSEGEMIYPSWMEDTPVAGGGVTKYDVAEYGGWVFLNTVHGGGNMSTETRFLREKESADPTHFSKTFDSIDVECLPYILTEKSLDRKQLGFVKPPITEEPPREINSFHYRSSYVYESVANSLFQKVFRRPYLIVETEFCLPHTTLMRVIYGKYISTIVMSALPMRRTYTRLFVKIYRNFWRNALGDWITWIILRNILIEDRRIAEGIAVVSRETVSVDPLQTLYYMMYMKYVNANKG